jgi:mannose-6-phosphate isomerase-like protein (cupin superfamily)
MNRRTEGTIMADDKKATVFTYVKEEPKRSKGFQLLARSDLMLCAVQVVRAGGETNLHSHDRLDGIWFVLRGRARFTTTDGQLLAELGPHEGVLIPREFPYAFERVGEEDLEILQVEASTKLVGDLTEFADGGRVDYEPRKAIVGELLAEVMASGDS